MEESLKSFLEWLAPYLGNLAGLKWGAYVLMAVGFMRVFVKPSLSLAYAIAGLTQTPKDNDFLKKMEGSKFWAAFLYVLDWTASIKPPPKADK